MELLHGIRHLCPFMEAPKAVASNPVLRQDGGGATESPEAVEHRVPKEARASNGYQHLAHPAEAQTPLHLPILHCPAWNEPQETCSGGSLAELVLLLLPAPLCVFFHRRQQSAIHGVSSVPQETGHFTNSLSIPLLCQILCLRLSPTTLIQVGS